MADGTVDPREVLIFQGIGAWMNINGEAIRGTSKGPSPAQPWGATTAKRTSIYLHVFNWPKDGNLLVSGQKSDPSRIRILSARHERPEIKRTGLLDLEISGLPKTMPDRADTVISLDFEQPPQIDSSIYIPATGTTRVSGMEARLEGGIPYRAGRGAEDLWVVNRKASGEAATRSLRTTLVGPRSAPEHSMFAWR